MTSIGVTDMDFEVTCDCGWSFRGPEEAVVEATIAHGKSVHDVELSQEQAREAARPVDRPSQND
jgi:predicted small metal-binding protein